MNKKIVIGMSGGVDSSVAAYLLKEQGYEVIGVTMHTWEHSDATKDAAIVAEQLGIPHFIIDFSKEFQEYVIDYFIHSYLHGQTPNPCIVCNRYVKWEALLKKCKDFGADTIATGHYARIIKLDNDRYTLKKSATLAKDQTYALYRLTQEQLAHTLMPVGEYTKEEIRAIAKKANLSVADKGDSQEICFIPDKNYAKYIEEKAHTKIASGNFVTSSGTVIGEHKGIIHYTIGQRKGLNLAMGHPVFVTDINAQTNEVVIGENSDLFKTKLYANKINLMSISSFKEPIKAIAKIRYSHKGSLCTITKIDDDLISCEFEEPQRAITPGQALVFYENDYLIGGGTIINN